MDFIKNWFSNFLPYESPIQDIEFLDILYFTPEHYYQAHKFPDKFRRLQISQRSAAGAKKLARELRLQPDQWASFESKKLKIMEEAVRYKFVPGTKWYEQLMATEGDIVEWNNWNDKYWGRIYPDGPGENHLGKILMKIRDGYKESIKRVLNV